MRLYHSPILCPVSRGINIPARTYRYETLIKMVYRGEGFLFFGRFRSYAINVITIISNDLFNILCDLDIDIHIDL